MKRTTSAIVLSLSLALATTTATAGGLSAPVMEAAVIEQETASSRGNLLVPIILLVLIAAAISSGTSGGGTFSASDIRLKADITAVGMSASGLAIYEFSYSGTTARYQGVMAQDVLSHTPDAVLTGPFGFLMVDYSKIDVEMKRIN